MSMQVLVVGAAGQLGAEIVRACSGAGHAVTAVTRRELDVTKHADVLALVAAARPDAIVNCTAYNDVDGAEDQHAHALDVNAFAVRSLARAAHDAGATLVHYSTDFVFDGDGSEPYTEDDRPAPQSVYASSKLLGEWFAADAPSHYVLRVESLFGGQAARSSIDRIIDAILAGREARVFVDRVVSPTYVEDCAGATLELLRARPPVGLYHCVNSGHTTWYDLAREIARQAGIEATLVPVPVASVTLKARRPRFCALSNDKLRRAGVTMPTWQDAIRRYLALRLGTAGSRG